MYIPAYNTFVWKYNVWKFFQNLSVCGEKASQIDKKKINKIDKCVFFVTCVTAIVNLTKKKRLFMMILTKLLWKLLCLVCFSQISIYALTPFWFSFNEALLDPENRTRNIPPIHIYNARVPRVAPHWMNECGPNSLP